MWASTGRLWMTKLTWRGGQSAPSVSKKYCGSLPPMSEPWQGQQRGQGVQTWKHQWLRGRHICASSLLQSCLSKSRCHIMLRLLYNCLGAHLLSFAMLSVALENALLTSSSVRISFTRAHLRSPFENTDTIYYKCVSQKNDQVPTSLAHPTIDGH